MSLKEPNKHSLHNNEGKERDRLKKARSAAIRERELTKRAELQNRLASMKLGVSNDNGQI